MENAVSKFGNLNISDLDFSDFEGDVFINRMKVKGNLFQKEQEVQGHLYQGYHEVQGDYTCKNVIVKGNIYTNEPTKLLKEVTAEELAELGYKLKGENKNEIN